MGNGIFNPKAGEHTGTEQNTKARRNRGAIGDRSNNLVNLIGSSYINKNTLDRHKYQDRFTEETYRTGSGIKVALPTYYKQKIWTVHERYRDWETDRKSTRLNSSHRSLSRMPSSA